MQVSAATYETVRSVKQMPTLQITTSDLNIMAMFVVLRFIAEDASTLVKPRKIQMIKELRAALQGGVEVSVATDYWSPESRVGLKESKDAIDFALSSLGIE
jgi:hypothetical protein